MEAEIRKETPNERAKRLNSLNLTLQDILTLGIAGIIQLSESEESDRLKLSNIITLDGITYKVEMDCTVSIVENK